MKTKGADAIDASENHLVSWPTATTSRVVTLRSESSNLPKKIEDLNCAWRVDVDVKENVLTLIGHKSRKLEERDKIRNKVEEKIY
jgi:hypothetical protein